MKASVWTFQLLMFFPQMLSIFMFYGDYFLYLEHAWICACKIFSRWRRDTRNHFFPQASDFIILLHFSLINTTIKDFFLFLLTLMLTYIPKTTSLLNWWYYVIKPCLWELIILVNIALWSSVWAHWFIMPSNIYSLCWSYQNV